MLAPEHPRNAERLAALATYGVVDWARIRGFDEITRFVSRVCEMPIAVISLVDCDRQWFLSEVGLGTRCTPLGSSVCAHAILRDGFFEVTDLQADPRFSDNPLVTGEPRLRFYAGAPLLGPEGLPLGMLCVMDHRRRETSARQRRVLQVLARRVMREIELRRVAHEAHDVAGQLALAVAQRRATLRHITEQLRAPLNTIGLSGTLLAGATLTRADRASFAGGLAEATGQMTTLVEELLAAATDAHGG